MNISITPKSRLLPLCDHSPPTPPCPTLHYPQTIMDLLSVTIDEYTFLWYLYKWNHKVLVGGSGSLTQYNYFEINLYCCVNSSLLLITEWYSIILHDLFLHSSAYRY